MAHEEVLLAHARAFCSRSLSYGFTAIEEQAIRPFFSNTTSHVFFLHGLPSNVGASLLARYSRLKNARGLRGIWVDEFLPYLLASRVSVVVSMGDSVKDPEGSFLKEFKVKTLDDFVRIGPETKGIFDEFLRKCTVDEDYMKFLVEAKRTRRTLGIFMDSYGHNSIARMASVWLCCERISMLAAKSIEWSRPGAGYIELSGRFVDLGKAEMYPIWNEYHESGVKSDVNSLQKKLHELFVDYQEWYGEGKGELPKFFRDKYHSRIAVGEMTEADFEKGVSGECFDLLSNLLPPATLTSVAVSASGEALPSILRHLALDGTPENFALIECIVRESEKVGAHQFIRHFEPTVADKAGWEYLSPELFRGLTTMRPVRFEYVDKDVTGVLMRLLRAKETFKNGRNMTEMADLLFPSERASHDKIPREFEVGTAAFTGLMTFRGWRDLQRMGLATHRRTYHGAQFGFYEYTKPCPVRVTELFTRVEKDFSLYPRLLGDAGVGPASVQYAIPMGFNVGYLFSANLRQHEFCNWQRSKYDVNDEVRARFMEHDRLLMETYPWWMAFSRCAQLEFGRQYLFARSEGKDKRGVLL